MKKYLINTLILLSLSPFIFAKTIHFNISQDSTFISYVKDGNNITEFIPRNTKEIQLENGNYFIQLVKAPYWHKSIVLTIDDNTSSIDIKLVQNKDKINTIQSIIGSHQWNAKLIVKSDSSTAIYLNDSYLGKGIAILKKNDFIDISKRFLNKQEKTTYSWANLSSSKVETYRNRTLNLILVSNSGKRKSYKIQSDPNTFSFTEEYLYPKRKKDYLDLLLPSRLQYEQGNIFKGIGLNLLLAASIITLQNGIRYYPKAKRDYDFKYANFINAPDRAKEDFFTKFQAAESELIRAERILWTSAALLVATYGLNYLDWYLTRNTFIRVKSNFNPFIPSTQKAENIINNYSLTFTKNF